ncbi:hypothetical protein AB0N14_32335 [Streptomyces sp. NPDC051104]|uniref:hypothetical protein n=1 Tax=Streptomyces sp. NPDC051104 TaxID=3155044 RepID=UPI003438F009
MDEEADDYLRTHEGSGSQKTYAYYLVDHLRWRLREQLTTASVTLQDLKRYMGGGRGESPVALRPAVARGAEEAVRRLGPGGRGGVPEGLLLAPVRGRGGP